MLSSDANPVVRYFRPRRPGPEATLEDAVARIANSLIGAAPATWIGGSLPVGAGLPDLAIVGFSPAVAPLQSVDPGAISYLAYLRTVRAATGETIAERMQRPRRQVERELATLRDAGVLASCGNVHRLNPRWRSILPSIAAVEAKVSDWRVAIAQASRNRIFAHRSYLALPIALGMRVRTFSLIAELGLGVVGIDDDGDARILRRARTRAPRVWAYYYGIARVVAREMKA